MLEQDKNTSPIGAFLVVDNLDDAAQYYLRSFGALLTERYQDPTGKVWYAVFKVYGAPLQVMEPVPEMGLVAKDGAAGIEDSIAVNLPVTNVDRSVERALRAGATVVSEPHDAEWGGRSAEVRDPFGHRWLLGGRLRRQDVRRSPLAPAVVVEDVRTAVDFWRKVFDATEGRVRGTVRPESPVTVVQVQGAVLQFTGPDPARGLVPLARRGGPQGDSAMITVIPADVDEMFEKAMDNGATPIVEPQDAFWGDRYAEFRDPVGIRVSSCGTQTLAEAVVNPADLQQRLNNFISVNNEPSSPAPVVGVQNIVTPQPKEVRNRAPRKAEKQDVKGLR